MKPRKKITVEDFKPLIRRAARFTEEWRAVGNEIWVIDEDGRDSSLNYLGMFKSKEVAKLMVDEHNAMLSLYNHAVILERDLEDSTKTLTAKWREENRS